MSEFQPTEIATRMAAAVINDSELQREMLTETIASGSGQRLEAGRTLCGVDGDPLPAESRSQTSVGLELCPADEPTALVHTHPSPQGLRSPIHSLPDICNVAFEDADASVVVGAEQSSVVYEGTDTAAMQAAIENAVGMEITRARDIIDAYNGGRITDPAATRQRVIDALGPLVETARTPHPEITAKATTAASELTAHAPTSMYRAASTFEPTTDRSDTRQLAAVARLRRSSRIGSEAVRYRMPAGEIRDNVVGTTVGLLTGRVVEGLLLG